MNKEQIKSQANQKIDEIFSKLDEVKAQKEAVNEASKEKYHAIIQDLENKKENLQTKYNDLMHAKDEKVEEVNHAFSEAADSFKEGFSRIASVI